VPDENQYTGSREKAWSPLFEYKKTIAFSGTIGDFNKAHQSIFKMKKSAGILLYRKLATMHELFLVHPGGPFWKNKDEGAWSIPKGEFTDEEDALAAAKREFEEETGFACNGKFIELSPVKLKSGKMVYAWALEKDIDPVKIKSNLFEMEWPPKSGKRQSFAEIDRAAWFKPAVAKQKINQAQSIFIDELLAILQSG
jgi:predicted NUDIX family NTP pyrophosphohydrolase